mgnify:CR=1 FL=1
MYRSLDPSKKTASFSYSQILGLSIGTEKFTLLRVDGDTLHAKGKGATMAPLTVQKSNQALIFGIGDEQTQAGQLSEAVYRIFNFLVQHGY